MRIYNYDKFTTEYLGASEASLDPLSTKLKGESVYVIPLYSTEVEPLEKKNGFAVCFNSSLNIWEYVEDFRGTVVYDKITLAPKKWDKLGPITDNVFLEVPKPQNKYQYWEDGKYVYPKLSELKTQIKYDIDQKYEEKLSTLYKIGNYYVQPAWSNIYTNTLVAIKEDMNDNGKLDNEYKILVMVDKKGLMNQIKINNIDEFLPYYNMVKELYKKLTEDYHEKLVAVSVTNDSEQLIDIVNNY